MHMITMPAPRARGKESWMIKLGSISAEHTYVTMNIITMKMHTTRKTVYGVGFGFCFLFFLFFLKADLCIYGWKYINFTKCLSINQEQEKEDTKKLTGMV